MQEIIRYQEMTRVPLAPPAVRGLINLRGQIVTAIDLRRCLELNERPGGVAVGLDLPATGFVLLGRAPGLLADADVLANAAAVLPASAGVIGITTKTGFPRHGRVLPVVQNAPGAHKSVRAARGVGARLGEA